LGVDLVVCGVTDTESTTPWTMFVPREAVVENVGETYWSVDSLDELPDDLADFVAPPVVVGAAPRSCL
jgi:hypothetical protein